MTTKIHIVGAGPTGLALATHFAALPDTDVHVYEKTGAIGGAHATHWVDGYLTQHAPVVYAKSYVNAFAWLRGLGVDTAAFFQPYAFGTGEMVASALRHFSATDCVKLGGAWAGIHKVNDESVAALCARLGLTPSATDYIDRLCRLLDGAGAARFAARELFGVGRAQLLQPVATMDQLWGTVQTALAKRGVVFHLNTPVTDIVCGETRVWHFTAAGSSAGASSTDKVHVAPTDKVLLAAPPACFPAFFDRSTAYDPHISVTLHYAVDLPQLPHGFPIGPWKIVYIQFGRGFSQRKEILSVVSATITDVDADSAFGPARAASDEAIGLEVLRQLDAASDAAAKVAVMPAKILVYKGAVEGYVAAAGTAPVPTQIKNCANLFSVGCQNRALGAFTSMETAVAAAHAFTGTPIAAPGSTSYTAVAVLIAIAVWVAVTWGRAPKGVKG